MESSFFSSISVIFGLLSSSSSDGQSHSSSVGSYFPVTIVSRYKKNFNINLGKIEPILNSNSYYFTTQTDGSLKIEDYLFAWCFILGNIESLL